MLHQQFGHAWKAYRLEATPLSVCEGEYFSSTRAAIEAKAVSEAISFIIELIDPSHLDRRLAVPVFCDNRSAVMLSESATSSKRLKHVATRIAFLREMVEAGEIILIWIPSSDQLADIFTKPLAADQFHLLRTSFVN